MRRPRPESGLRQRDGARGGHRARHGPGHRVPPEGGRAASLGKSVGPRVLARQVTDREQDVRRRVRELRALRGHDADAEAPRAVRRQVLLPRRGAGALAQRDVAASERLHRHHRGVRREGPVQARRVADRRGGRSQEALREGGLRPVQAPAEPAGRDVRFLFEEPEPPLGHGRRRAPVEHDRARALLRRTGGRGIACRRRRDHGRDRGGAHPRQRDAFCRPARGRRGRQPRPRLPTLSDRLHFGNAPGAAGALPRRSGAGLAGRPPAEFSRGQLHAPRPDGSAARPAPRPPRRCEAAPARPDAAAGRRGRGLLGARRRSFSPAADGRTISRGRIRFASRYWSSAPRGSSSSS